MKLRISFLFSLFVLFSFHFSLKSQNDRFDFYAGNEAWMGGLNFGINSFWGDVTDNTNHIFPSGPFQASFYKSRNFALGGFFGKRITPFWSVTLDFKFANVTGENNNLKTRFFSKFNQEYTLTTTIDILKLANVYTRWTLYPRVGVGIYGHKLVDTYSYHLVVPFGLGFGYRPLPELHLFFETSMSWVKGDLLDGVKSDERSFEGVWTTSIGISYQFDFPAANRGGRGVRANDPALRGDGINKQYRKRKQKSNISTWNGKSQSRSTYKGSAKMKRKRENRY